MSNNAELYFGFLIYISSSDGEISKDEILFISESIESLGLDVNLKEKLWKAMDKASKPEGYDDFEWLVGEAKKSDPGLIMTMVRDGYALIEADGVEHKKELQALGDFLRSVCDADQGMIDRMIDWSKKSLRLKEEGERIFSIMESKHESS